MSKLVFASVISEIQQSDVFMSVKARICEAPAANLNGARVTEAFIDEIVGNDKYVGLPLYADVKALTKGDFNRLGHLYDVKTGEFHSTQIGSFYKFEKQVNGENCYLVGYARIPKRNKKLSKAISALFADNALKFSFELSVGEYEELDDDTILIDASENNYLEGTAIVTYPACEDAVALELVAQKADETRKGDEEMAEVENKAEVVETEAKPELAEKTEEENSSEVNAEKVEETACKDKKNAESAPEDEEKKPEEEDEEETACKDKKNAETETACSDKKENAETENAAVIVHETHEETHATCAYDTETGKEVCQRVTIEEHTSEVSEGTLVETYDGVHVAEKTEENTVPVLDTEAEQVETPAETPVEQPAEPTDNNSNNTNEPAPEVTAEKKTAEEMIAELMSIVAELKSEIAELKEQKADETKVEKAETVVGEINPFVSDMNLQKTYSLLEKAKPNMNSYSLLEKW